MTDILSKQERSTLMSKVRSADTKPEWILRCGLHRLGFRYRLGNRHLPGRPDLVLAKYRSVIFVHGCYWHRHPGCKDASTPKTNTDFWSAKFAENVRRDRLVEMQLLAQGWRVLVVWECELVDHTAETVQRVALWLRQGIVPADRQQYSEAMAPRRELLKIAEGKVRYRIGRYHKP